MQKWEYLRMITYAIGSGRQAVVDSVNGQPFAPSSPEPDFDLLLTQLGEQGWELVTTIKNGSNGLSAVWVFKRPKM